MRPGPAHGSAGEGWADLVVATTVTVTIAVPVLIASDAVELFVWPELLRAATGQSPDEGNTGSGLAFEH